MQTFTRPLGKNRVRHKADEADGNSIVASPGSEVHARETLDRAIDSAAA
jgi:hypothetical protein